MKYVALLRGVNVGGKNKIVMKELVRAMADAGFREVSTYINSGNIFFSDSQPAAELAARLGGLIRSEFGLAIKVLLRDEPNIARVAAALPANWQNNEKTKCDVMFLWSKYDDSGVLKRLTIKPAIDEVRYVDGAVIWRAKKRHLARSGMMSLPGTDLYAHMTVRNCNTLRKIAERLE